MKIELLHDYFIDASARGYVLKQRKSGKTKDGQEIMREKKIGYYDNLTAALESFCRRNQDSEFGDLHTYFADYAAIPLAGHNTQFDVQFIKKMFKDNHRSFDNMFLHRIVDTYSILKFLQDAGIITDGINSSAQAFKFFEITVDGRHTALGDARATMRLYEKMIQLLQER